MMAHKPVEPVCKTVSRNCLENGWSMVPEALESLSSEERRRIFMLLKLTVTIRADGVLAASGVVGSTTPVCEIATLSS
jgi:hypothetical protein